MIELQNFYKVYSSKKNNFTVEDVSFKIEKGTIAALLGANGSGKSTILKAITNFHYPTKGKIFISDNNHNIYDSILDSQKIMQLVGYVPEISLLPKDMFVFEFLKYCAELHFDDLKKQKTSLDYVIQKCSLEKVLKQKIKTLSKGYAQRLSFAQAIIHNPPNLILDEPISGLDPLQIIQLRKLIIEVSKEKAILMSTHILQEVYSLCSKIFIMNNGKIVCEGSEDEIIKKTGKKNLEDSFLFLSKDF